jgi:hypothetical protein
MSLVLISVRLSKSQGLVLPEGLGKLEGFSYIVGSRTRCFRTCVIVPLPLRYRETHVVEDLRVILKLM